MKAFYLFLYSFNLIFCLNAFGENDSIRHNQITVILDNDAYVPGRLDRYYSNGISIGFHHYLKEGKSISFRLGKEMYTPDLRKTGFATEFDRPYAGMVFGEFAKQWRKKRWFLEGEGMLGILGPGSGVSQVHYWFHDKFGFPRPEGWETQLGNAALFNLSFSSIYQVAGNSTLDFNLYGNVAAGNWDQNISLGPILRFGKLLPFSVSQLTGSRVGVSGMGLEQYFQLGIVGIKSFWEGSVDGGNFDVESAYDSKGIRTEIIGEVVLNYRNFGFSYGIIHRSKYTSTSDGQIIGRVRLSWLF